MQKVLLLFRCVVRGDKESDDRTCQQFMEGAHTLDAVGSLLGRVYLRWGDADGKAKKVMLIGSREKTVLLLPRNGLR